MIRLAPLALLALAACTQERPTIILPPADLATCAAEPEPPSLPPRNGTIAREIERDTATLGYVLALVSAGGDCRAKVKGLAEWRATANEKEAR